MLVKALLFDLDGTLFGRDTAVRSLVTEQYKSHIDLLGHIGQDAYVNRVLALDAHGHGEKSDVYAQVASDAGLSDQWASRLTEDFWQRYPAHCHPDSGVLATLDELRARGLKLGIVTNGRVMVQEPVIAGLGLGDRVDVVLISEREGVRKPDTEIFDRALQRLGVDAGDAWFVGDHPQVDVEGAVAAGMSGVWREVSYWPSPSVPHRRIQAIQDLLDLD